jgi:hypothetical protein
MGRALVAADTRGDAALRDHVLRFDWTTIAPRYDDTFEELVKKTREGGPG